MTGSNRASGVCPQLQGNLTLSQRNPTLTESKEPAPAFLTLAFRDRQLPNGIAQPQHEDGARMSNAKREMKESHLEGKTLKDHKAPFKQLERREDSPDRTSEWTPSSGYRGPRDDRSRSPKRSPNNNNSRASQTRRRTMRLSSMEALDAVYSILRDVVLLESCWTLHGQFRFPRLVQTKDGLETAGHYLEIHYGDMNAKKRREWIAEKMRMLLKRKG